MGISALLAALIAASPPLAQDCQSALGPLYEGTEESALPNQVDGSTLAGAQGLIALRRQRGDALITIKGGDFSGADLRRSRLHNICFIDTKFAGSDWTGAEAPGVGFLRADLAGATLVGAQMPRVQFRNASLSGANATRANFSHGRLDGGWWQGNIENLRLDDADLSFFRFECGITLDDGCPIDGEVSAARANLSHAFIHGFQRLGTLDGARIDGTEVGPEQLETLASAEVAGPISLRGGDSTADLSPAEFRALLPRIRRPGEAPSPSFDCARASRPAEREICGENGGALRALDSSLASLYRAALARDPAVERSQARWLAERDQCLAHSDVSCLNTAYERRREALVARLGPPAWLRPGTIALFIGPVIEFDDAFYAEPLYRRLLPVLIGASWSKVLIKANADGTIDARGDALGANAHSCSLGGNGLAFDRSNGWFSGPYTPAADDPASWRDRPMPVLLLWQDRAQVYQHGRPFSGEFGDPRISDYASCGMRAAFGDMMRVPISTAEAERLFAEHDDSP